MYPMMRLRRVLREARRAAPLAPDSVSEIALRCWPWDIDMFGELNNGRALTLFDLGRFDLAARIGLMDVLRRERWGLAVAGASVRFRRRVRRFDQIAMRTQAVGCEPRWLYLAQTMRVAGEPVSSALLRTCVTSREGIVPTDRVSAALGGGAAEMLAAPPDWVAAWSAADETRPWPPTP